MFVVCGFGWDFILLGWCFVAFDFCCFFGFGLPFWLSAFVIGGFVFFTFWFGCICVFNLLCIYLICFGLPNFDGFVGVCLGLRVWSWIRLFVAVYDTCLFGLLVWCWWWFVDCFVVCSFAVVD